MCNLSLWRKLRNSGVSELTVLCPKIRGKDLHVKSLLYFHLNLEIMTREDTYGDHFIIFSYLPCCFPVLLWRKKLHSIICIN